MKKITCISDTHGKHNNIKILKSDILIHAGDVTVNGTLKSFVSFLSWYKEQPSSIKIFIGGNHDKILEDSYYLAKKLAKEYGCIYLENESYQLPNIKIWGSPFSPKFLNWHFMANRGKDIARYWSRIPKDTDLLITHGPPYNILDLTLQNEHVGCYDLLQAVKKNKPKYHIFGHIHSCYGMTKIDKTTFINTSVLEEDYNLVNEPIIFDYE